MILMRVGSLLVTLGVVEEEVAVGVVEGGEEEEEVDVVVVGRLNRASRDSRIALWRINGRNRIRLAGRIIIAANSELRRSLEEEGYQADHLRGFHGRRGMHGLHGIQMSSSFYLPCFAHTL
jgi:hypothetical protein